MVFKPVHRGDNGYTDIVEGRIEKDSPIIEFIGELDELISFIGLVKAYLRNSNIEKYRHAISMLTEIQQRLMSMASYVATLGKKPSPIDKGVVNEIEEVIKKLSNEVVMPRGFIIPGSSVESSLLHVIRAICRRVERRAVKLLRERIIDSNTYVYLNRLSDLLYVLALYLNKLNNIEEELSSL